MFALTEVVFLLIFVGVALAGTYACSQAFKRERHDASESDELLLLESYHRYAKRRFRILQKSRTIMVGLLIGITFCGFWLALETEWIFLPAFALAGLFFQVLLSFLAGLSFADLFVHFCVDAPVLQHFHLSSLSLSAMRRTKLRYYCIRWLPSIALFQALILLAPFQQSLAFVYVLFAISMLVLLVRLLFQKQIATWISPGVPLQSVWSNEELRIRQWIHAAGDAVGEIRLRLEFQVGGVEVHVVGSSCPTLFLNELALRFTDWRQRDALVGCALGAVHTRLSLRTFWAMLSLIGVGVIALTYLTYSFGGQTSSFLGLLTLLLVLGRLALRRYVYRRMRKYSLRADQFGASLTKDIHASIVLLHTLVFLNGMSLTTRTNLLYPTPQERVEALEDVMRHPGPHAPYADEAISSVVPVVVGTSLLTRPFSSTSRMTAPAAPTHPSRANQ